MQLLLSFLEIGSILRSLLHETEGLDSLWFSGLPSRCETKKRKRKSGCSVRQSSHLDYMVLVAILLCDNRHSNL